MFGRLVVWGFRRLVVWAFGRLVVFGVEFRHMICVAFHFASRLKYLHYVHDICLPIVDLDIDNKTSCHQIFI